MGVDRLLGVAGFFGVAGRGENTSCRTTLVPREICFSTNLSLIYLAVLALFAGGCGCFSPCPGMLWSSME